MKLIENWRIQLNKLWSVRLAIFTALLASADQILAAFNLMIPPFWYGILSLGIIVARLVYQPALATSSADATANKPTP